MKTRPLTTGLVLLSVGLGACSSTGTSQNGADATQGSSDSLSPVSGIDAADSAPASSIDGGPPSPPPDSDGGPPNPPPGSGDGGPPGPPPGTGSGGSTNSGGSAGTGGTAGTGGSTGSCAWTSSATGYTTHASLVYVDASAKTSANQVLDLLVPNAGTGPFPVVIRIHGGGFSGGGLGTEENDTAAQAMLAHGFAIASLGYRLSSEAKFPAGAQDVKAAVRWLRANAATYNLDSKHFAAWGESAGGWFAAMLGVTGDQSTVFDDTTLGNASYSSAVQATVVWWGPVDFATSDYDASSSYTYASQNQCGKPQTLDTAGSFASTWICGNSTGKLSTCDSEALKKSVLENYIPSATSLPVFILEYGLADCTVPWGQGQELYDALNKVDNAAQFTKNDGYDHGDARYESVRAKPDVDAIAAAFCNSGPTGSGGSGGSGGTGGNTICGAVRQTYTVPSTATGKSGILVKGSSAASQDTTLTESAAYTPDSPATVSNTDVTSASASASTSGDDQSFFGYNSGILVKNGGVLDYSCGTVTVSGQGNGVFAFNSTITLNNVTIHTTGDLGHGVDATFGGKITLTNTNISTTGAHGAALSTDRGGGTITAYGGVMTTAAADSPGIYSTGTISATDSTITATGGEGVVIEGLNSVTLTNVKVTSQAAKASSPRGIMIYQSMSGDASGEGGVMTMTGGSFSFTNTKGTLFLAPTSTATLNFNGVGVTNNAPTLLSATKSLWSVGTNPVVTLNATSTALTGNVEADSNFAVVLSLAAGSSLTAAINSASTARSVTLAIDASSTWTLTGNSNLTSITGAGTILKKGYALSVSGSTASTLIIQD
jgi:acetyl esterase/lipase